MLSAGFSPQIESNSVRKILLHDLRLARLQSVALDHLLLGERAPLLEHRLQLLLRRRIVDVVHVARQDSAALQAGLELDGMVKKRPKSGSKLGFQYPTG